MRNQPGVASSEASRFSQKINQEFVKNLNGRKMAEQKWAKVQQMH